jgi:hypothetical protein
MNNGDRTKSPRDAPKSAAEFFTTDVRLAGRKSVENSDCRGRGQVIVIAVSSVLIRQRFLLVKETLYLVV